MLREHGDVPAALAQRRQLDAGHGEAKEEIVAELPDLDLVIEIAPGRGDHPHVDADRSVPADALDLRSLEHAQELGLERGAEIADLVDEERAPVGLLEDASVSRDRAREGAFSWPKSSDSTRLGATAVQSKTTNGPAARGPSSWMDSASTSCPCPSRPR